MLKLGRGREKRRETGEQGGEWEQLGVHGVVASSFCTREQRGREGAAGTASSGPSSTMLGRYRGERDEVFL